MQTTITERPKARVVDPDLPLVNASRNGDLSAFEVLVKQYDRKLYRIAQGITHSDEDAEEAVQTAFLKAYQNLSRFQGKAKFSTWLIRIAMNESFLKLRKQRSNREQSFETPGEILAEGSHRRLPQHPSNLTDWATGSVSLYSTTEIRQILEKSLQKLRSGLRVVFILRDIEGHSIRDTSGILKLTPASRENPSISSKASIARRAESVLHQANMKQIYFRLSVNLRTRT